MAPTLHMVGASPPCRAVLMTANAIGLNFTEKIVQLQKGEHLQPEYLKLNPQHTVPTFVTDDGFTIWDSHAIMAYIVSKYGKNDSLYPKDLKKRALVDQRLHFESGVLAPKEIVLVMGIFTQQKTKIDDTNRNSANEVYGFLEAFLDGRQWIAGNCVTIADYSIICSLSALNAVIPVDGQKFPRVVEWMKKVESLPEYEPSKIGLEQLVAALKGKFS